MGADDPDARSRGFQAKSLRGVKDPLDDPRPEARSQEYFTLRLHGALTRARPSFLKAPRSGAHRRPTRHAMGDESDYCFVGGC